MMASYYVTKIEDCSTCKGSGVSHNDEKCPDCEGEGVLESQANFSEVFTMCMLDHERKLNQRRDR
jgi:DnaJ-class molecular chaperone